MSVLSVTMCFIIVFDPVVMVCLTKMCDLPLLGIGSWNRTRWSGLSRGNFLLFKKSFLWFFLTCSQRFSISNQFCGCNICLENKIESIRLRPKISWAGDKTVSDLGVFWNMSTAPASPDLTETFVLWKNCWNSFAILLRCSPWPSLILRNIAALKRLPRSALACLRIIPSFRRTCLERIGCCWFLIT